MIDWQSIEGKALRRYAKAAAFREIYDGGSAKRVPVYPARTGRMTVAQPPLYPVRVNELGAEARPISQI